jgi:nitrilase
MERITAAVVQATPVFLDREATVEKTLRLIGEAAERNARLIAFPEVFVPNYPEWVWRLQPWSGPSAELYERLLDQAVEVPGPATEALGRGAAEAGAYVTIGVDEREPSGSTLFNTVLTFAPDGSLLGKHRKLMATGGERLVWAGGDASTLEVYQTPFGRIGGLICWENYMPLARAALYAAGVDVWIAPTWDDDPVWVATLQHIAKEGRVFVLGVNTVIRATDVPAEVPGYQEVWAGDDSWMTRGRSAIVDPHGEILAGPLVDEEGILTAEIDISRARAARMEFDAVGHYGRPDVFDLRVNAPAGATTPGGVRVVGSPEPDPTGSSFGQRKERRDMLDIPELHRRAIQGFGQRLRAVTDDQWHLPTPCAEWDVRMLVNHVTGENLWTVPLFGGKTIEEVGDSLNGDILGEDPKATWDASEGPAIAAVQAPGAMERSVHLSRGPAPGHEYATEMLMDYAVHAWDLAKATGGDEKLDPEVVAFCVEWFGGVEDAYRAAGAIAERPPIPEDADPQTVLLAMTGRDANIVL